MKKRTGFFLGALLVAAVFGCSEGSPGTNGATGATGSQGPAGTPGATGANGAAGQNGATGPSGPQGDAGPPGPVGDAGPKGPPGSGVIWKDATGAIIPVVGVSGAPGYEMLEVADASGYVWNVGAWSGAIDLGAAIPVAFTQAACGGTGYLAAPGVADGGVVTAIYLTPRYVFRVVGDSANHAIPDAPTVTNQDLVSALDDSGCNPINEQSVATIAVADTAPAVAIVTPTSLFTPPAHPEYVP